MNSNSVVSLVDDLRNGNTLLSIIWELVTVEPVKELSTSPWKDCLVDSLE